MIKVLFLVGANFVFCEHSAFQVRIGHKTCKKNQTLELSPIDSNR